MTTLIQETANRVVETYYIATGGRIASFTIKRTKGGGVSHDYPRFKTRFTHVEIAALAKTKTEAKAQVISQQRLKISNLKTELQTAKNTLKRMQAFIID